MSLRENSAIPSAIQIGEARKEWETHVFGDFDHYLLSRREGRVGGRCTNEHALSGGGGSEECGDEY